MASESKLEYAKGYEDGMKAAFEMAAKEAEKWWEIFDFNSFAPGDHRRFANPNQIASRIRSMADNPEMRD